MLILGYIVCGLLCTLAVVLLLSEIADRRWARREEKRRQRLIDRTLGRAER